MQNKDSSWPANFLNGKYNDLVIIFLAMLYVTTKLTCNLLDLRLISVSIFIFDNIENVTSSSFLYPLIYIINIYILMLKNKNTATLVALIGIVCDGIFSFGSKYSTHFAIPNNMTISELNNTLAVNTIAGYMWNFYDSGIVTSIISAIISLNLFILCKKIKISLFFNMLISSYIPIIIHHLIKINTNLSIEISISDFLKYSIIYISALVVFIMMHISIKSILHNIKYES